MLASSDPLFVGMRDTRPAKGFEARRHWEPKLVSMSEDDAFLPGVRSRLTGEVTPRGIMDGPRAHEGLKYSTGLACD